MLFQDLIPCGTRTRLIASHAAVFDLDLHGHNAFLWCSSVEKLGRTAIDLQERNTIWILA
jgi:hypothetical protein